MTRFNSLYYLFLLVLMPALGKAQATDRKVDVVYKQSESTGEYIFKALNPNPCEYTVYVDVVDVVGLKSSVTLPLTLSIKPGETTLFSMKPSSMGTAGSFRYLYSYLPGRQFKQEPPPFVYAMPAPLGKPVAAQESQAVGKALGLRGERLNLFTSVVLQLKAGDTVFAARRGIVVNRIDGMSTTAQSNITDFNMVEICHTDGTLGQYARLQAGSLLVKRGESVELGQPIGLVADPASAGQAVPSGGSADLYFSVRYLPPVELQINRDYKYIHIRPRFATKMSQTGEPLQPGRTYEAVRPIEMITLEMSKKEIKRYLKQ